MLHPEKLKTFSIKPLSHRLHDNFVDRWLHVLTLCAILSCNACDFKSTSSSTEIAESSNEPEQLYCNGIVDLENGIAKIIAYKSATVSHVFVREGDRVEAGTPLLRFANTTEQFALERAQLNVKAAKEANRFGKSANEVHRLQLLQVEQQIEILESRLNSTRLKEKATQELADLNQASKVELLTIKCLVEETDKTLQVENTKLEILRQATPEGKILEAESQLAQAEALLREAEFASESLEVKATTSGTVLRIDATTGGQVAMGQPVVMLAPVTARIIRVQLDHSFSDLVAVAQSVIVVPDAGPSDGREWRGVVASKALWFSQPRTVGMEVRLPTENKTLECVIRLDSNQNQQPPTIGMRVRAIISLSGANPR